MGRQKTGRARIAAVTLITLVLAIGTGVALVNPRHQRWIYVGGYALRVPKGFTFDRTDTGKYRLLLDSRHDLTLNKREMATIAGRGLLGDLSAGSMVTRVIGTGWFPKDTRVCLAGDPERNYGQETWAVQYYRQTYLNGAGMPYRERHGVLLVRHRRDGGGLVVDVSRMQVSPAITEIDWEPVRAHLGRLLENIHPTVNSPRDFWSRVTERGIWAEAEEFLRGLRARLPGPKQRADRTPTPLDAAPAPSLPVCVGPYELHSEQLDHERPYRRDLYDGLRTASYRLRHGDDLEARVAFRAKPFRGHDPVGFDVIRSGWLGADECARGVGPTELFHNRRGVKQAYERFSNGQRYVGVMAVIRTKASGTLVFDVSDRRPTAQEIDRERLKSYLERLRFAVIVGDYTVRAKGELNHGIDIGDCQAARQGSVMTFRRDPRAV
jgi:hypothetical protein